MAYHEFTGKTVRDAIAKACEELVVEEALLDIEVLEESTRGFLGIVGHRDARVRVKRRDILKEVLDVAKPRVMELPERVRPAESTPDPGPAYDEDFIEEPEPQRILEPAEQSRFLDEARTVLEELLKRIPVEADVHASMDGAAINLDIKGDGSGLLIGKKGQTLDALQFLVSKIVNKHNPPGSKVELVVDTENYRLRKRESLREMAQRMSQKAKKTAKPVSLNPMPPHERRIVHLILAEDREVYTKSYGEGALRRIIVYPRRAMASKRRRR